MKISDQHRFRDAVLSRAGNVPANALRMAVDTCIPNNQTDVADCLLLAGRIAARDRLVDRVEEELHVERRTAGRATKASREKRRGHLLQDIETTVANIRRQLFGADTPPFSSVDKAARWLARQSPGESVLTRARSAAIKDLERVELLLDRIGKADPYLWVRLDEDYPFIDFEGRAGQETFLFDTKGPLWDLYLAVQRLSRATGMHARELTSYILAGRMPDPPPIVFRGVGVGPASPDPSLRGKRMRIELNIDDVTEERFRLVYRTLRRWLKLSRKKGFTDRDRVLLQVVRSLGGVPPDKPNSKAFWDQVPRHAKLCRRFKTWAAAREAYRRAAEREARAREHVAGTLHLVG